MRGERRVWMSKGAEKEWEGVDWRRRRRGERREWERIKGRDEGGDKRR